MYIGYTTSMITLFITTTHSFSPNYFASAHDEIVLVVSEKPALKTCTSNTVYREYEAL